MVTERSEVYELVAVAIKAADSVGTKDDLTRCIDVLKRLKALSLSAKDLRNSSALQKLGSLRDHRNPKIRKEARSLFCSWLTILNAKPVPTKSLQVSASVSCSVLKNNGDPDKEVLENEANLLELFEAAKKAADAANTKGILLGQSDASRSVDFMSKLNSSTVTQKVLEDYRIRGSLERLTKHKDRRICSSAAALLQHWRKSIKNQECRASMAELNPNLTQGMLYASGKSDACKAVPVRPFQKQQQQHDPLEVSGKLRGSVLQRVKNNSERRSMMQAETLKNATELREVFEAAKKAADAANVKGILLGQSEASRCVHYLSKLKNIPVNWEVVESHGMEKRLEHLTKHKDRKICSSATALLQHWRQSSASKERHNAMVRRTD